MSTAPTPQAIAALAAKLTPADATAPGTLTADEARLIAQSLGALATAQLTIERQASLLASFNQDAQAIERAAGAALASAAASLAPSNATPTSTYDPALAARARADLSAALSASSPIADVIAAVLTYVARLAAA